ncbi:MFS transporter [Streptomyces sioyaensis]|uniref:MFS transporter n=1 Tax=Streptomyces sioyaensis TaxID=67364 RepID=UPI0033D84FDB
MITEKAAPGVTASLDRADGGAQKPGPHSGGGAQLLILALGFVMAGLDTGIMNVAATDLRTRLGLSMSGLTWVVDGYVLAFAALLLLAGSLAKRYGACRIYLIGLAVFTAASLLVALTAGALAVAAVAGRLGIRSRA